MASKRAFCHRPPFVDSAAHGGRTRQRPSGGSDATWRGVQTGVTVPGETVPYAYLDASGEPPIGCKCAVRP